MSQEQIAKVLTEHQIDWWDDSRALNEYVCTCRKVTNDHAAHQAAILAPLIVAAQAEALRDAAEDAEYELDLTGEAIENAPSTWLRTRATHIEGRALVAAIHERKAQG